MGLEAMASEDPAWEAASFKSSGRRPGPVNGGIALSVGGPAVDTCSSTITLSSTDRLVTWRAERARRFLLELYKTHTNINNNKSI